MTNNSFKDYSISNEILRALDQLQYHQPTPVQREVIPAALLKNDMTVKSQTGSGKTAAFAIPLCELIHWEENKPQALVLTPTRELAEQVKEDITNIGRYKRVKAISIYGKQPYARQKTELKQKNHIVSGTPGRVLDHIQKDSLSLEKIKYLVIDEADEMLNMGFLEQVEAIIKELPVNRTTMLFSATLPEEVQELCHHYMNSPIDIQIQASVKINTNTKHTVYTVNENEKLSVLKKVTIVENPDSCIIFCRTKERVDELSNQLDRAGYPCDKIHGGMVQEDRFAVMNEFKRGEFRYLIATDVAARGIDIENISLVINYDFPMEKESYVHRTGRTGRAGNKGKAVSFVTEYEDRFLEETEAYIGFELTPGMVPSKEEVMSLKGNFKEKINLLPDLKMDKRDQVSQDIMRLYFNGGKKKKLRAVDFVGTIAKIDGIHAEDIGIITIYENATYVEILNGKGPAVLQEMKTTPVKGKRLKVHKAREN
ncbi:DEAD/DEAH box helicase [Jeotgalibacillus proteolyticus]|uniref:ATP-dependent RNA helicase DbpA n=1 Tax=Jeotgalibacillus proteolyticus TaxID=2082395 RepID=A0A2S5G8M1_9BACL|nr:DEAD/DEAH box helicase [Jeotgalibacillus proteolyticus]PPA69264.1 RNA helicase [Jeotgalibacillus proteolyticus]